MMKNDKFTKIILFFCIMALSLGVISIALSAPPTNTTKYGYAKFGDATNDVIKSDDKGQYADCHISGGEDRVEINYINSTGALNWVKFYPGRIHVHYPQYPPSTRRVKFNFDVAGGATPGEVIQGWQGGTHEAVREILRWYNTGINPYPERNIDNHGYLNDSSLHVPITVNGDNNSEFAIHPFDDMIQFAIEPNVNNPDTDIKAVTLPKVRSFYSNDPDTDYWYTQAEEGAQYIIYHIAFDNPNSEGFITNIAQKDRKGKAIAWSVKPDPTVPMKLCVATPWWDKGWENLTTYGAGTIPFEIIFSLVPFTSAPPLINDTVSTTWCEIKGE
jgi:hypothetical protein